MTIPTAPEPRAHHIVPKCWLAGFTETGENDGRLWVADLKRKKQWPSSPINAGHRRDFYRLSDPELDPVAVEKALSEIEDLIAPLLRSIDVERRGPTPEELEPLLFFMAIQWVRVPAFRPLVLAIADSINRNSLKSREEWATTLRELDIPADSPGADYDGMVAFLNSGDYSLTAETDWYMQRAFKAAQGILPSLTARRWAVMISRKGSFVASDNPVQLDGFKGQMVGFKNAGVVLYPLSRHVLLWGTNAPMKLTAVTNHRIAQHNTFTMLTAEEQVYSHEPDFCWLDETGKYQTDWALFSKEKF
jgi:hypothetical protein